MGGLTRRQLVGGGLVLAAGGLAGAISGRGARDPSAAPPRAAPEEDLASWQGVRALFDLDPAYAHLGALLVASHPRPVRDAIARHRLGLDRNPVRYLAERYRPERRRTLELAARYFGADRRAIALTDSTTMGLGLLYGGLPLRAGDEVLTTAHGYYSTRESLRYLAARTGARVREIRLHERAAEATSRSLADAVLGEVGPRTRVVALTWVHSDTGLKLPVRAIADGLAAMGGGRGQDGRILLCVDGVHGFGVEDVELADLGCDFFAAGTHKWLFGPRGTGVLYARDRALFRRLGAIVPPFGGKPTPGLAKTPGGFHSFDHRWAVAEAFELHLAIGKDRVAARTRALASRLKAGLAANERIRLHTPVDPALSAGIVAFDVRGRRAVAVLEALLEAGVVGTIAPYGTRAVRLTPSIVNDEAEIDRALEAIASLA